MLTLTRRCKYGVFAINLAGLMALPLFASAADGTDEAAFFAELPQVVTVTRLAQNSLEIPAAVTVIDRRMIEASGVVSVPDLLRLAAGFLVAHPDGTRTVVNYHGMTDEYARRMQVLVDGRSVYSPVFGGVEWPLLGVSLEDIDRIEVTRGPNGVSYGANAFLGVINIITLHPALVKGDFAKVTADGDGSFERAVVRHGGRHGPLDYRITLDHRYDSGQDDSALNGSDRRNDISRVNSLSFRGEYHQAVNDYIGIQFGYSDAVLGYGLKGEDTNPVRNTDNNSHFQQLGWHHVGGDGQESKLQFYHEHNYLPDSYQTAPLSTIFSVPPATIPLLFGVPDQTVSVDNSRVSDRYDLEWQYSYLLNPSVRAVSGLEARQDRVKAPGLLNTDNWLLNNLYRGYTNGEWRITSRALLNGGLMVERNDLVGTKVSPRLALNYQFSPTQSVRASYSRAYRTPSLLEDNADYAARYSLSGGVIDQLWKSKGGLGAERIDDWELGLAGVHPNGLSYDVKLFSEKMTNLISTPVDNYYPEPNCSPYWKINYPHFCDALVYVNYGTVTTRGAELQMQYRPGSRQMLMLAWSHIFSRKGDVLASLNPTSYYSMVQSAPEDTVTLLGEQSLGDDVSLSAMVHHVDSWFNASGKSDTSFTTASARLSKGVRFGTQSGKLSFWINDLLGSYVDYYGVSPISPRSYLSVELAF